MEGIVLVRNIEVIINENDIFIHDSIEDYSYHGVIHFNSKNIQDILKATSTSFYEKWQQTKHVLAYLKKVGVLLFNDNSNVIKDLSLFYSGAHDLYEWLEMAKLFYRNLLGNDYILSTYIQSGIDMSFVESAVEKLLEIENECSKERIHFT